ncbi:sugar phosphate isomerase/epimerase family protein [Pectinatus brassicae]|uniref:Sugar phosphate isomerase/epimerase n=1 Tax=Pectinatus brassicae TaxID=862415 RepID=A0A840UV73_9FIRM|nr:sugar phosphate isomerase/epimerase family protein [Pectinatus brassicae]MBB5336813.1 sugar phosphate isomerase/epimerase [Pectinatus brassicae]
MKLSISNIAWSSEFDNEIYIFMQNNGFSGLEIAPTRIFPEKPYECLTEVEKFSGQIKEKYGIEICSMQSIWYGRTEHLFGSISERQMLIEYTKKAIEFAKVANCKNIVFGSPKNRIMQDASQYEQAVQFFAELGQYAERKHTCVAIEANPAIYGTNFINTTAEAFKLCRDVNSDGIGVNVDLGTIIENKENLQVIFDNIDLVNHIHVSEPYLNIVQKREIHTELSQLLFEKKYNKYISVEMKKSDIEIIKSVLIYIKSIFGLNN